MLGSVEDDDDGSAFDQFKGKKSSYRDDLYTTKIDDSKITEDLKKKAAKVEREILTKDSEGNKHVAEERQQ